VAEGDREAAGGPVGGSGPEESGVANLDSPGSASCPRVVGV
jgi:hypothetical protein